MKKTIFFILLTAFLEVNLYAQNDTMYVMKNGVIVGRYNVNNQIDSLIYYNPVRGTFTDSRDGNTYNWVKIGNQVWMAENLKYLPSVVEPATESFSVPYHYVYGYYGTDVDQAKETSNYNTYGVLYNWPAAMAGFSSSNTSPSGVQGVCPSGWHLPSDAEWSQLETLLGGGSVAGAKLKETGTTHWISPNTGATNEVGFKALPGGYRGYDGTFISIGITDDWWCTTEESPSNAYCRYIDYNGNFLGRFGSVKRLGYSVRCVKN